MSGFFVFDLAILADPAYTHPKSNENLTNARHQSHP